MDLLCRYLCVLSAGLAVLNTIPCYYFDGQHIIMALIHCYLRPIIQSQSMRQTIAMAVTSLGTLFLIVNLVYTIVQK